MTVYQITHPILEAVIQAEVDLDKERERNWFLWQAIVRISTAATHQKVQRELDFFLKDLGQRSWHVNKMKLLRIAIEKIPKFFQSS
jgi:hypothetical protein